LLSDRLKPRSSGALPGASVRSTPRLYPRARGSTARAKSHVGVRMPPRPQSILSTVPPDDPPGKKPLLANGSDTPFVACGELTKESVIVPTDLAPSLRISVLQTPRRGGARADSRAAAANRHSALLQAEQIRKPPHSASGVANARLMSHLDLEPRGAGSRCDWQPAGGRAYALYPTLPRSPLLRLAGPQPRRVRPQPC
jgi:hypothetical protein